ncbi:MAG: TMEM43 family protein [Rudaea sp.]
MQAKVLVNTSTEHIDAANDGRHVRVSGVLSADGPARDPQLGVHADMAVLLRIVEMYQWQEHCADGTCRYAASWGVPVDSHKFREPQGHENPQAPFTAANFAAPGLKLGAFAVDAAVLVAQARSAPLAVSDTALPPNLAASFSAENGSLYAGGDPASPHVGMLRVRYRVVPLGAATLEGVQHAGKLTLP